MCENIRVLPPPPSLASMLVSLVHEATVCRSVSFFWASKGFVIEFGVLECMMGQGKLKSGLVVVWCFNADP